MTRYIPNQDLNNIVQVIENTNAATDIENDRCIPSLSQSSIAEEYCTLHANELYVAHDSATGKLMCNQCIYQSDIISLEDSMSNLNFTSYIAGNLKDLFDKKFEAYRNSLHQMQTIAPQQISQQLEGTVDQFFNTIEQTIKEVETRVIERITQSKNLAELEQILAESEAGFGLQDEKQYEAARQEIDNYVKQGQYAAVVGKKDLFESLIKSMNQQNSNMTSAVQEGQKRIEKIMTMKQGQDAQIKIGKRLHEIIDSCLEIDVSDSSKRQRQDQTLEMEMKATEQRKIAQQRKEEALRLEQAEISRQQEIQRQHEQRLLEQQAQISREKARMEEIRIEQAKAEQMRIQMARDEQARQEQIRIQQEQARVAAAEQVRLAEQAKLEQARAAAAEQARQEQIRAAEQARLEQARAAAAEQARQEQARAAEQARLEQARAASAAAEQARQEQLRAEQARQEQLLRQEQIARQQQQLRLLEQQREQARLEAERVEKQKQEEEARQLAEQQEQLRIQKEQEDLRLEQQRIIEEEKQRQESCARAIAEHALQESILASQRQRELEEIQRHNQVEAESQLLQRIQEQNILRNAQIRQSLEQQAMNDRASSSDQQEPTPRVSSQPNYNKAIESQVFSEMQIESTTPTQFLLESQMHEDDAMESHQHVFDLTGNDNSTVFQQQPSFSPMVHYTQFNNQIQHQQSEVVVLEDRHSADVMILEQQEVLPRESLESVKTANLAARNLSSSDQIQIISTSLINAQLNPNVYASLYKLKNCQQVIKCTPLTNGTVMEDVKSNLTEQIGNKVVGLPGDRIFIIGGSRDTSGKDTLKDCFEIISGLKQPRAGMFTARSNFGCAVYPNFSQIFIAGGSINEHEATKACERYIVKDDQWKRLPELREAKINISLCFFNNGGTLYCFGGATKHAGQIHLSRSIERLSKGQNNWQLLSVQLPEACMDVGACQLQSSDTIMLFGGFTDNIQRNVYFYNVEGEGRFEPHKTELQKGDYFQVNGCFVQNFGQFIFAGQNSYHKFDTSSRSFTSLEMQQ